MATLNNDKQTLEVENAKSKSVTSSDNYTEIQKKSWEFFKNINGLVTDFLNKQINIPSTAFTPNFCLPTKEIFSKILFGKSFVEEMNKKSQKVCSALNPNSSDEYKQAYIVKKTISEKFK